MLFPHYSLKALEHTVVGRIRSQHTKWVHQRSTRMHKLSQNSLKHGLICVLSIEILNTVVHLRSFQQHCAIWLQKTVK